VGTPKEIRGYGQITSIVNRLPPHCHHAARQKSRYVHRSLLLLAEDPFKEENAAPGSTTTLLRRVEAGFWSPDQAQSCCTSYRRCIALVVSLTGEARSQLLRRSSQRAVTAWIDIHCSTVISLFNNRANNTPTSI
jgi:hypothetical protein